MSVEEHIKKLECLKKTLADFRPFGEAVQSIHADRVKRIFTDGKNSFGGQIGEYSTKPIYISTIDKTKSPKKPGKPEGKHGRTVFESTGKPHTSRYFPGGYFQFRVAIGRNANTVNLTLFGNLKSNFSNGGRGQNAKPEAIKISPSEYRVGLDAENSLKKKGLEEKYGNFIAHTQEERKEFNRILHLNNKNAHSKC